MTKENKKITNNKKRKESKPGSFYRFLARTLVIVTILTLIMFYFINIIPFKFFILLTILLIIIDFGLIKWLFIRNYKRVISSFISLILVIVMIIGIFYEINTIGFLKGLGRHNYKTITYELVVRSNSGYEKLKDLDDKSIGLLNTTESDYNQALKFLDKKLSYNEEKYEDNSLIAESLLEEEIDAMLIEQSNNNILEEANETYKNNIKVIYTFDIQVETEDITKKVDVTKDSFNIYISGIDTYGKISTASRSDVNMVVTVNPKSHEVRITSIPRDYYVKLHSKPEYKDKLTHAGIFGVEESVATIEELLNIDINYYVKVNFTSLIDIVDTIGPIVIHSNYSFTTGIYDEHTRPIAFAKGKNTLNGEEALAFARERKSFAGGDRVRNENQQIIIKAIADRVLSSTILVKYNDLLSSLSKAFITNMTDDEITSLVKQQLDTNAKWNITNYVLEGTDGYDYTYSYKTAKSYVMIPDSESINLAISEINKVFNAE